VRIRSLKAMWYYLVLKYKIGRALRATHKVAVKEFMDEVIMRGKVEMFLDKNGKPCAGEKG